MKAIVYTRYGPPGVLEMREVAKPSPADDEVLIRVRAAAVTTADCIARRGDPFIVRLATGLNRPKKTILGTELSGQIEAVGKDVRRLKVGDEVFAATGAGFGAHAEYVCLPEQGALASKPAGATYEDAVAVCEGGLTALPFLRDSGRIQRGQRVLINGASGSVGTSAVQLARYFGAEVTGVCSTAGVALVKSLGADKVIDYTKQDFTATSDTYDIVFDAVGKSSFSRCKRLLAPQGVYLSTVLKLPIALQTAWTSKRGGKRAVITLTGLRPPAAKTRDLLFLKGLVEAGEIRPVIDRCYPLDRTADAHAYVEEGHKKGHVVVTA